MFKLYKMHFRMLCFTFCLLLLQTDPGLKIKWICDIYGSNIRTNSERIRNRMSNKEPGKKSRRDDEKNECLREIRLTETKSIKLLVHILPPCFPLERINFKWHWYINVYIHYLLYHSIRKIVQYAKLQLDLRSPQYHSR